jgi:lipopolysaccharide biosynthesis glycosyltransferase
MNKKRGFLTKSDHLFYEGLAALLASIGHWHPDISVRVVDCGLSNAQLKRLVSVPNVEVVVGDITRFRIPDEMQHYYTPAVYGFYCLHKELFDTTIHVDADAILCTPIHQMFDCLDGDGPGIAAVADWPTLDLSFQIGDVPHTLDCIAELIPQLDITSIAFNGGVFVIDRDYYLEKLLPHVERILPLHGSLWGNDQAVLNLAAFAANPGEPWRHLAFSYNARPTYRRDSTIAPQRLIAASDDSPPKLTGHFGDVHILHFVGKTKPWMHSLPESESDVCWQYWRDLARSKWGL